MNLHKDVSTGLRRKGTEALSAPQREHVCVHMYASTLSSSVFCEGKETGAPHFPGLAVLWFPASGSQMLATRSGVPYSRFACSGHTVENCGSVCLLGESAKANR